MKLLSGQEQRGLRPVSIKRRATAVLNSIDRIIFDFSTAVARHLKPSLDCLQAAFSLKIRLVLISSSAIANHEVIIPIIFLLGLTPSFHAARGFAARVLRFRRAVTLQRKIRDCSQSKPSRATAV